MAPTPTSQDDWTVHALNIHGVFFERRCASVIAATENWTLVSCNYPVEYPAPNGPWRGKESSLDIRARRVFADGHVVDVQIECKKANPDFVNWIFFSKASSAGQAPFWTSASINTPSEIEGGPWTTSHVIQNGNTDMPVANDSREVRSDYIKHHGNGKTKTSNAAIQDASYQVALANRAIVGEDSTLLAAARNPAGHPNPPWLRKTYIPIIVTTARLFQAEFLAESVDIGSGEIPLDNVGLKQISNVLYEYPLPKHLQHAPVDTLPALLGTEIQSFTRMHIVIVQAESLQSFLVGLQ